MPDIPSNRETGNAMTIGIVLAGIVAALILAGSFFFQSDQKGVDVTVNQPSTELTGDNTPSCRMLGCIGVGFGRRPLTVELEMEQSSFSCS